MGAHYMKVLIYLRTSLENQRVHFTARKELRGTYISVSTAVYCSCDVSLKKSPPCAVWLATRRRTFSSVALCRSSLFRGTIDRAYSFSCTIIRRFIPILCNEYLQLKGNKLQVCPITASVDVSMNCRCLVVRGCCPRAHVMLKQAEGTSIPCAVMNNLTTPRKRRNW